MECAIARAFVEDYFAAAMEYIYAAGELSSLAGSHEEFAATLLHVRQARLKCRAVRVGLEKHRVEHNCRLRP